MTNLSLPQIQDILHILLLEKIIIIKNDEYWIENINNNVFLRIIVLLNQAIKSYTKTEIKILVKSKITNDILNQLIQSQFIYEYRTEFSKRNYLILTEHKEELINLINQYIITDLQHSNKTQDKAHYKMLSNNQSILVYGTKDMEISSLPSLSDSETKLIINLLNENYQKHCHKIGKTEDEINKKIFNNKKTTQKILLSLIDKKIIRCSLKGYYYINNVLIDKLKIIYKKNMDLIIKDF